MNRIVICLVASCLILGSANYLLADELAPFPTIGDYFTCGVDNDQLCKITSIIGVKGGYTDRTEEHYIGATWWGFAYNTPAFFRGVGPCANIVLDPNCGRFWVEYTRYGYEIVSYSDCSQQRAELAEQCFGEENITNWDNINCTGECIVAKEKNLGGPTCPLP